MLKAIALGLYQEKDETEKEYVIHTMFVGYDKKLSEKSLRSNMTKKIFYDIRNKYAAILSDTNSSDYLVTRANQMQDLTKQFTPEADSIPPLVTYGTTRNIGNEDDAAKIKPTDPLFKQNVPKLLFPTIPFCLY